MNEQSTYDVAIIGGGPAGYTAGIYAARASLNAAVFEQGMPGGQIATSDTIDNYPAFPSISGAELGMKMQEHSEQAGAQTIYEMVNNVHIDETGEFDVETDSATYHARSLIVATGARPRLAGFKGENDYRGRGISYCATCDGMFYRGKDLFVVGGGNSAVEEAMFLAKIAKHVTMVVRKNHFRASRGMVSRLLEHDNVSVRFNTSINEVTGGTLLNRIEFIDTTNGESRVEELPEGSFGIFVFTGNDPVVDLVKDYVDLGSDGGVITDDSMMTKTPGLFCVGDMRTKQLRQVITAAADGAIAGTAAYRYLEQSD
ncbi:NAD(P)/FAD-dependent oxidoreductase [Collinsella tanakaei]|jgi:thioredoxin reductase (NADPH)|uniref:FAD-binding protein n=1 Tax=Collinsella tanakaei TaxID=626935 RepID=A0A3E4QPU9_9ACTN|nr:FAD-dependent oxidoreductase [Collinsella tanakaei]RGL08245.1 FAD-binding protein [Collinsella tanakaei]